MNVSLAVLIVEDSESDTQLIVRLLKMAGYDVVSEQVETAEQMCVALEKRAWDVVISDYSLPQFSGKAALELLEEKQQDIPFIIVSGVIGEETAVAMLKAGAHDYLMKGNLERLVSAIERELENTKSRRQRKQADDELRESERRFRLSVLDLNEAQMIARMGNWKWDLRTSEITWSDGMYRIFGIDKDSYSGRLGDVIKKVIHPDDLYIVLPANAKAFADKKQVEYRIILGDGSIRNILARSGDAILDESGNPVFLTGIAQDITEQKLNQNAIIESNERFNNMFERHDVIMLIIESQTGSILNANQAAQKFYGYPKSKLCSMSTNDLNTWPPEQVAVERQKAITKNKNYFVFPHRLASGEERIVEVHSSPIMFQDKQVLFSIIHDITDRIKAEELLRKLSSAVTHSPSAIIITDVDGKIEYVNTNFTTITGYTSEEVLGRNPRILKSGLTSVKVYEELWHALISGKEWRGEILNRKKNGDIFWEFASISAITDPSGRITHFVSVTEDISVRKAVEEKIRILNIELEKLAMTDFLTGLFNRRFFIQRSTDEVKRAKRNAEPMALLMLDFDEFKKVNDIFGHETGDLALQQVASVMSTSLREIDILGRMGGEEFAVLLPNTSLEEALLLAERVRQSIENISFEKIKGELKITASIGVASFTDEMSDIDDLLRNADWALYQAKSNGRNRVKKYIKSSNNSSMLSPELNND
ncbi:MAG: diguanylate cyclase [Chloroflexi bacterium]|nr:diguanylate cyclase [Chloroflexota bacterium]